MATGWKVRGSNPGGGARFSAPVQTGPGAHPTSCTMGTGSFPRVKSGRGVTLTLQPLLVPWSWKSRAIPLHPLWAVRPVQSLSVCTRGALYLYPELKKMGYEIRRIGCVYMKDWFIKPFFPHCLTWLLDFNPKTLCQFAPPPPSCY